MVLDRESCWRAVASKDRRFDGRFVIGVVTTGIYCRPGCPAPAPKRRNVLFFVTPAAAEDAGLRPCMRCRPDATPGTPAWVGSPATVQRALRLLAEGGAVDAGLPDLASRLGIGDRHLRRLFAEHVGASPIAVARTQKLHFARKLIDETDLPMVEVALSSGFRSIRRFNDAVRGTFRRTPTELRRKRQKPAESGIVLRLAYREPFDFVRLLAFLRARAIPGVESVSDHAYRRTIAIDGVVGTLEVALASGALALRIRVPLVRGLYAIVERVRSLFDLRADPAIIVATLGRDATLARSLRARPGLRVPGAWDGFELAVRAILGQQVSVTRATALSGRLVEAFGEPLPGSLCEHGLTRLFPPPAVLARADIATALGIPGGRAEAIRALGAEVARGAIAFVPGAPDPRVLERLLAIRGIGPWTVAYVAMRALADTDAFPDGDLGLRQALGTVDEPLRSRDLVRRAEAWRPWRAYAAMHLWSMRGGEPK